MSYYCSNRTVITETRVSPEIRNNSTQVFWRPISVWNLDRLRQTYRIFHIGLVVGGGLQSCQGCEQLQRRLAILFCSFTCTSEYLQTSFLIDKTSKLYYYYCSVLLFLTPLLRSPFFSSSDWAPNLCLYEKLFFSPRRSAIASANKPLQTSKSNLHRFFDIESNDEIDSLSPYLLPFTNFLRTSSEPPPFSDLRIRFPTIPTITHTHTRTHTHTHTRDAVLR